MEHNLLNNVDAHYNAIHIIQTTMLKLFVDSIKL